MPLLLMIAYPVPAPATVLQGQRGDSGRPAVRLSARAVTGRLSCAVSSVLAPCPRRAASRPARRRGAAAAPACRRARARSTSARRRAGRAAPPGAGRGRSASSRHRVAGPSTASWRASRRNACATWPARRSGRSAPTTATGPGGTRVPGSRAQEARHPPAEVAAALRRARQPGGPDAAAQPLGVGGDGQHGAPAPVPRQPGEQRGRLVPEPPGRRDRADVARQPGLCAARPRLLDEDDERRAHQRR